MSKNKEELQKKLTDLQYKVTQEGATEPPFKNQYVDNHEEGIYVDVASGEPLFSSIDKYDSGSGWPSFTKPLEDANLVFKEDRQLWSTRTEVRSKLGDSHLGHVFDDGPNPTGKRYCMNSAALRFVPRKDLAKENLSMYEALFPKAAADHTPDLEALAVATFGGGCFWCMEPPFEHETGVVSVTSGYMGGTKKNPTYEDVSAGGTGHVEVVQVRYNPKLISYETLLEIFWTNINPTTPNKQFVDEGPQYRSIIFVHDEEQRKLAEWSKVELASSRKFSEPIVTDISTASEFYPAEECHQDYHKKNPVRYKFYRVNSGRDAYLEKVWKNHKFSKK